MHCSPNWTRVACTLAERLRSAPQALGTPCSRWLPPTCERPILEPPQRRAPAPALVPSPRLIVCI
eukprot:5279071-Pleurochrysis_carterae.AAC.6